MTKYLKLLMVALLASLNFTFTACGDDDDVKGEQSSITINGQSYNTHKNCCVTEITDYSSSTLISIELHPSSSNDLYPVVGMEFVVKKEQLTDGMTFTLNGVAVEFRNSSMDFSANNDYTKFVSGSISVDGIEGSNVTLKFNNLTVSNTKGDKTVIEGTITVKHQVI